MSATRKQHPPRKIKFLVFGGGGFRTIYTKGVLDSLAEEKILPDIEAVVGTSGGCMAAFLLALGYNPTDSFEFLERHVLEGKFQIPFAFIPEHSTSTNLYYKVMSHDGLLQFAYKGMANMGIYSSLFVKNVLDAIRSGGIFHTQGLADVLWKLIQESPTLPDRLKKRGLTFSELHQYRKEQKVKFPDRPFVDLFVMATEATSDGLKEKLFSYQDTPQESIIFAGSASMAIAKIFRKVGEKRNLYDGGIVNNVPRNVFDKPNFFEPDDQSTEMNMRVLAVCFADSEATIAEWRDMKIQQRSIKDRLVYWLISNLFWDETLWQAQIKEHQKDANALRTLFLNCEEIPILGPDSLSRCQYLSLCQLVAVQTNQYIDNYLRTSDPHLFESSPSIVNHASFYRKKSASTSKTDQSAEVKKPLSLIPRLSQQTGE